LYCFIGKIWRRFGEDLEKIWRRFREDLEKIWRRFGEDLEKIWRRFGEDYVESKFSLFSLLLLVNITSKIITKINITYRFSRI